MWTINNADVLLLSRYVPDPDVGLYRVASRVGVVVSYAVSAFMMAWGPLSRTPLHAAVEKERGWASAGSTLATYFTLGVVALVLALATSADALVRIAPPAYSGAASLIPLIGAGFGVHGLYVVIYRLARFPRKRLAYILLTVASAIVFLLAALVLIPALGSDGAALSVIVGPSVGVAGMLLLSQKGPSPVPFQYGRVLTGTAAAAICFMASKLVGLGLEDAAAPADAAALAAFAVLLVALGVIPRQHVRALISVARSLLPKRAEHGQLAHRLAQLSPERYTVVRLAAHERRSPSEMAEIVGVERDVAAARLVDALRELAGIDTTSEVDPRVADYLLSHQPVAERDAFARRLWSDGADPIEMDALQLTLERLRRVRGSVWNGAPARRARARL